MEHCLAQCQHSLINENLTGFELYLGQPDSSYWVHNWCLCRFREMPRGMKNGPFSVTNPASLDVSIRQNGESVCELYCSLREFHCLFKVISTNSTSNAYAIGILGRGSLCGETARITRSQQRNSSGLP